MKESLAGAVSDPRALAREFAGFDPMVGVLIARIASTFRWGLYDREPLPTWTRGRLTLLGDAAHPMLPHTGQGANQAIEDAVTLAAVLSRSEPSSAARALQVYELLRRERCARIQRTSRINGARYDASDINLAEAGPASLPPSLRNAPGSGTMTPSWRLPTLPSCSSPRGKTARQLALVCLWPIASVRCVATIWPVLEVKPTCHGRGEIDAFDPLPTSKRPPLDWLPEGPIVAKTLAPAGALRSRLLTG